MTKKKIGKPQERRELRTTILGSRLEVREQKDGKKKLRGYAVVFNSPANIGGSFIETIAPGSFTKTLREDDQIMLRDHKSELLLGRRSAGTLSLTQDKTGVAFEVTLPDTALGQDTYENVRLGNLKGCSFGFFVRDDEWSQDGLGNLTRIIKDIQCFEVTLTAMPAYESTSVDLRSVRSKLRKKSDDDDLGLLDDDNDDDDDDSDGDDDEQRCDCACENCQAGNCDECTDTDCDDEDCADNDCPAQITRAAHLALLTRRLRS